MMHDETAAPSETGTVADDQLRLIFTCCHPALAPEVRMALTLRLIAGLQTTEVARAFLVSESTMAQRLVRAKHEIRVAKIPYRVPDRDALPARLASVLTVVYLVFNEGHVATSGDERLGEHGQLARYHLFHTARGDMLERVGRRADAVTCYDLALSLVDNDSERRVIEARRAAAVDAL